MLTKETTDYTLNTKINANDITASQSIIVGTNDKEKIKENHDLRKLFMAVNLRTYLTYLLTNIRRVPIPLIFASHVDKHGE